MEDLIESTVPKQIRIPKNLTLDDPLTETQALNKIKVGVVP